MILFEEALQKVIDSCSIGTTEKITFKQAAGRILAEDVVSDMDMPPFDKSAMDGFAIRESDKYKKLTIIETVAAGQTPKLVVEPGTATRIMTGAPIPKGADCVVQVELSELINENTVKFTGHSRRNIVDKASDLKLGDTVLSKGQLIDARHIAVMATVGCIQPTVYKQPIVGIISTGDELVEPKTKPGISQIRNSNGHQLVAQVLQTNAIPIYYGIVKDSYEATFTAIEKGLNECDVLLLTGGVSMGDFDFVPKIMTDLGISILFDRVAVQPGKPSTFGIKGKKLIFGLPGNPVSSFVQFELLVKPAILAMMGSMEKQLFIKLPMEEDYSRKKDDRKAFIPVKISDKSTVIPTEYHGSAHINSLTESHGFAIIEIGTKEIKEGELVNVRLF